ncbi:MAG: TetR/AcrR family transcriptional regulator [Bacteroidetes bacterium]|nr:TetR/AcrR family transcriptional regulator [Bacteroidota bacterium]
MRKKEGNKEQAILNAAIQVFAQYGYHKAKVTDIAELAGVATGSVYLYYENKEALLTTIFEQLWQAYTAVLRETVKRTDIDPLQKIDAIVDLFFSMFISNPSLALVFVNEHHQLVKNKRGTVAKYFAGFLELAEEIYREGVRKHLFDASIDVRIFRDFLTGGMRNVLRQWADHATTTPLDRIRDNVKHFIKHGLIKR